MDAFPVKDTSKRQQIHVAQPNKKTKPKTYSYKYYIELEGKRKDVCKVAFLSQHGVTDKRIKRLRLLKIANKSPHDRRGKSAGLRSNAVPRETSAKIHHFIESIPVKQIHYSNNVLKQYLSSELNVTILHKRFCADHPTEHVNYQFFRNYFNENFNLSLGRPQCSKCEELGVKSKIFI